MAAVCEECGNHSVQRRELCGAWLGECDLCGCLHGDPAAVQRILDQRKAAEWGVGVELLGLIDALEAIPDLEVERGPSLAGGDRDLPPAIFFVLQRGALERLDRLTRSLLLACRHTSTVWTIEATHQGRLMFVLRPRLFHSAASVSSREAAALTRDLVRIREGLERDRALPWWSLPPA